MFAKCDCKKIHIRGEKTDIWALGITLFYLISGRTPFDSATNPLQLKSMIQDEEIDFSFVTFEPVRKLLMKMLKKDPEERISLIDILKEDQWVSKEGNCKVNLEADEVHDDNYGNLNRMTKRIVSTHK